MYWIPNLNACWNHLGNSLHGQILRQHLTSNKIIFSGGLSPGACCEQILLRDYDIFIRTNKSR